MEKEVITRQEKLVEELVNTGKVRAHYTRKLGQTDSGIPIVDGWLYESMTEVRANEPIIVSHKPNATHNSYVKQMYRLFVPLSESNLVWLDELDKYAVKEGSNPTIYLHGVNSICKVGDHSGDGVVHDGNCVYVFKSSRRIK